MLRTLHIENVAVIETADVTFGEGLHVLTGETGAGKSIVIDAISAILGERTPREVIRTGAAKAFVSAVFDGVPELAWFAENGVDYDPEALLEAYGAAFSKAQALRREIDRLDMDEAEKARLVETLEYQIGEIERAELRPGEDEELEARRKLLQNAEKL